jgi:hypothetical protein
LNEQATLNTICPISNINASLNNHLTTLGFDSSKYVDFTTDHTVKEKKRFKQYSKETIVGGMDNQFKTLLILHSYSKYDYGQS